MAASVEFRKEEMSFGVIKDKEKNDDLSLFVDLNDDRNINLSIIHKSEELDDTLESEVETTLMSKTESMMHCQEPGADDLLSSENNTSDYDWLLSPPRNPLPPQETEAQRSSASRDEVPSGQSTAQESKVEMPPTENPPVTNAAPRHPASSNGIRSSSSAIRRPSPSRKATSTGSRSATPTARPTLPSAAKPLRSSTPTSRATAASTKPLAPPKRSSTPTRPSARSISTPRPSLLTASKPSSRSSTPTQRSSNPSGLPSTSVNGGMSSSVTKSRAPSLKNPVPSRGNSPSLRSRPSKNHPEMPGFSTEAPANLKKPLPERSVSASKGRPAIPIIKVASTETNAKTVPKRSSSSPSRGPVSNCSSNNNTRSGLMRSRGYSNGNDDVNPVLMGTKMVERVVNMRKLAPPKQDDQLSNQNATSGKSSLSQDSGFGRTMSKKSFDMALRHLDIRRSMPGNMRAMITKIPASSVYSVRSESTKSKTISASDSPLTTSSNASSEHSFNNNGSYLDDNDLGSENGNLDSSDYH